MDKPSLNSPQTCSLLCNLLKNKVLLLLAFFFLLRVGYSYFFGWRVPEKDGISYNDYAIAILNQKDWLTNPDFHGDYRAPGYPILIALIYLVSGVGNLSAVYIIQSLLNILTIYYIFRLSSLISNARASFLVLIWAGFYVFYIRFTGMIVRETLVFFLSIFSFYHLWIFLIQKKEGWYFIRDTDLWKFLIAFTFLLHTDPRYLFYLPFISILFLFYRKFKTGALQYSYMLIIMILLLTPWTIRNYIAYRGFVLINTRTVDTRQNVFSHRMNRLDIEVMTETDNKDYPNEEERNLIKRGQNPNNRSREELEIIKKNVYPASSFLEKKFYYFKDMWLPFRFWYDYEPFPKALLKKPWSLPHNITSMFCYGLLIPFGLYAFIEAFRKREKYRWFFIFIFFTHGLLHFIAGIGEMERYRVHIDAFIIIVGCYGMVTVYEKLFGVREPQKEVQTQET